MGLATKVDFIAERRLPDLMMREEVNVSDFDDLGYAAHVQREELLSLVGEASWEGENRIG